MQQLFIDPISGRRMRSDIPGLDGLRAISILIVMVSHSGLQHIVPGVLGVTVFFFISGFLITTLLHDEMAGTDRIRIGRFYIRRVLRLYPPLLIYVAAVSLAVLVLGRSIDGTGLIGALFYFANYLYALSPEHLRDFGVHLWSLSVEEHFYLFFPALFLLIAKRRSAVLVLSALCLAALLIRMLVAGRYPNSEVYTTVATECRFDTILCGCITAIVVSKPYAKRFVAVATHPITVLISLGLILGTLLYRDPVFRETWRYTIQNLALISLVTSAVYTDRYLLVKRMLNTALVRWIGILSYSLYLWHVAAYDAAIAITPSAPLGYALGWIATFLIAIIVYRTIELPIFRLRRRFGSRAHESALVRA